MATIRERLRLADYLEPKMRRKRVTDAALGQVAHEDPGLVLMDRAGNTITIRLYLEDGKGGPRHRYKIIWTTSADRGQVLHQYAAGVYEHVKGTALYTARKEQRIRALLYLGRVVF